MKIIKTICNAEITKTICDRIYQPIVFILADTIIVLAFATCLKIVIFIIDKLFSSNTYIEILKTLSRIGLTVAFALFVMFDLYIYLNELNRSRKKSRRLLNLLKEIDKLVKEYE